SAKRCPPKGIPMAGVRDADAAADEGAVAEREPRRLHQPAQGYLLDRREDLLRELGRVGGAVLAFPSGGCALVAGVGGGALPCGFALVASVVSFGGEAGEGGRARGGERLPLLGLHFGEAGVAVEALGVGKFPTAALADAVAGDLGARRQWGRPRALANGVAGGVPVGTRQRRG